jgi:3-deoxy-D-manno-octulosonic-acid transferase
MTVFEDLKKSILAEDNYIWIHCASLGEFEQGKPIIEGLKSKNKDHKIILTFFSPSGFEIRKDYKQANLVCYLPIDTIANARKFVNIIKPKFVIFVKYEFWFNYLNELKKQQIPVIFISSIFRKNQYFFKSYGSWFRKQLIGINHFFVQNDESENLLQKIGIPQVTKSGDTRFDSVFKLAKNAQKFEIIEKFKGENKMVIAGSTWPPDEELLFPILSQFPEYKFIIASHEVHPARVAQIQKEIGSRSVLLSSANSKSIAEYQVLIIDRIGMLAHLYLYADIAYIGGGFGSGLHNIQEPITFGIPVIFGLKYHNFQEAVDLVKMKGAFSIKNQGELETVLFSLMNDINKYQNACQLNKNYVDQNVGASSIILEYIQQFIKE